ncbi:hypothetical protein CL638_00250 [bacterium]|nr:hypothetical protein [bacterium]|tara:strand:- start:1 stop:420 length:420 start_codon:yes stop_codon:yes gene_type:complete
MNTNTFVKPVALGSIAAFAFLGMVSASLANAATYLYVSTSGSLEEVEANTATEAINTAPDIMYNSGVILKSQFEGMDESDSTTSSSDDDASYAYVDESGDVEYVDADSDDEALEESEDDAADDSGVLNTEEFDDSDNLE